MYNTSSSIPIIAGPCPPNQVSVQIPCESKVMSVSWQISPGSVSYLAVAQSSGGQRFNCSSNWTTCDIPGLQCGQTYEVYVSGVVGTCIGPKSQSQIVKTGEIGHPLHSTRVFEIASTFSIMNVSHSTQNIYDHILEDWFINLTSIWPHKYSSLRASEHPGDIGVSINGA